MKLIWEEKDIKPGMWVSSSSNPDPELFLISISASDTGNGVFSLVSVAHGHTLSGYTREGLAEHFTGLGYYPVTTEYVKNFIGQCSLPTLGVNLVWDK